MSIKSIYEYTVIREYLNLYGMEETVEHIIRHHIENTSIENLSIKHSIQKKKQTQIQATDTL